MVRLTIGLLSTVSCLMLQFSCNRYSNARLQLRDDPEMAHIHIFSGQRAALPGRELGRVSHKIEGHGSDDCDAVVKRALHELLEDARGLGGTGVADVRFRARFNWRGEGLCWTRFGSIYAEARGIAVDERTAAAPAR